MPDAPILVINTGSSSLKAGLYAREDGEERAVVEGLADKVGSANGSATLQDATGKILRQKNLPLPSQKDALETFARWFAELNQPAPQAVGHRVVHGGPPLVSHQLITEHLLQKLKASVHFAPLHIPGSLALIEETRRMYPKLPQFACFDTAFHRTMPEVATRFALPAALFEEGLRRYGFHGLSYESIVHQLGDALPGRTVIAHLGSGASVVAVKDGQSIDTSMGLTPTGGIVMATRSGDLDPGVLLYLLRTHTRTPDLLEKFLNRESGLLGISGSSGDMRDLEARTKTGDSHAEMAIRIFCRSIAKTVASYAAVLGGIDLLVFTGGIGEHSALVRREVCAALQFMGLALAEPANEAHASTISAVDSRVQVKVIASQEDGQIARHCRALMSSG